MRAGWNSWLESVDNRQIALARVRRALALLCNRSLAGAFTRWRTLRELAVLTGAAAHRVGWQPCRACRPLRGDELVGTRPVAAEGGGPGAATSEAKRAWLAKQAVPSWRSRMRVRSAARMGQRRAAPVTFTARI